MEHTRRLTPVLAAGALLLGAAGLLYAWLGVRAGSGAAAAPAAESHSGGRTGAPLLSARDAAPAAAGEPEGAESEDERRALAAEAAGGADKGAFCGRLVDRATGEPVGCALLRAGDLQCEVGADGRWRAPGSLAESCEEVEFHDPVHGSHIRSVARADLVPDAAEGWLAPIAVGPTTRVEVLGVADFDPLAYEARLVEVLEDGSASPSNFQPLRAADPPWFRYDNPWKPDLPSSAFRVEVRDRLGLHAGASDPFPGPAVGIRAGVVTVVIDQEFARVFGRVVDAGGAPKDHATVQLQPLGQSAPGAPVEVGEAPKTRSGGDGSFELRGVHPGEYLVSARPRRGETPAAVHLSLPAGELDLGDLVVGADQGAGMIEGRLESRAGRPLREPELVRLRAVGGGFELFDTSSPSAAMYRFFQRDLAPAEESDGSSVFEFNEAPGGELELSVVPQDGYVWTPSSIRVTAPDASAVFVREDDVPHRRFRFDVVDDATGEEVPSFDLQLALGEGPPETRTVTAERVIELPAVPFAWLVSGPGYRAARGNTQDFVSGDPFTVRVGLKRGFSLRLTVRDFGTGFDLTDGAASVLTLSRPLVRGARILADGRPVATAGDGTAWIELEREPERLSVELPGWRLVESPSFRGGRLSTHARDVVVWMLRD